MPTDEAVTVAYVCGNTVHYSWHRSLADLVSYDVAHEQRVIRGGELAIRFGSGELTTARNDAVRHFLDEHSADWLWWVDTDMGFAPDTVDRLFDAADPVERPIVGGLCFFNREDGTDEMGGYRTTVVPTVYDWVSQPDGQQGWAVRWQYPVDALTRCNGTGSACILIHRSVFDRIAEAAEEHPEQGLWYDRINNPTTGVLIGEDLSFCLRAGALGIPIHVHTGVPTTHCKPMWLSEEHYARQVLLTRIREGLAKQPEPIPESVA